jgi:hypothetical protein
MSKFHQGIFKPKNPRKYKGDPTKIVYRSSWELKCMNYFDQHPGILAWSSEEIIVPYICPTDGRAHRYFPDFVIMNRDKKIFMIEVKPSKETAPPVKKGKKTKRYIQEVMTWGKNEAKWKAAEAYCKKKGWEFMIMTEKELKI